jgi:hypothetical protein
MFSSKSGPRGGRRRYARRLLPLSDRGGSVPGSILFESCYPVPALAFGALAIIAPAGKSVPVLAIWVETSLI